VYNTVMIYWLFRIFQLTLGQEGVTPPISITSL
jgi:hypothetical protein